MPASHPCSAFSIAKNGAEIKVYAPYEIKIVYSNCRYLEIMKEIHPEIFVDERTVVMRGDDLLKTWSQYLKYEKEMVNHK